MLTSERTGSYLDKITPRRGEVIDLQTGLHLIAVCSRDLQLATFFERLAGYLELNDDFFVMYKRQVFGEKTPKELISAPIRLPEGHTFRTAGEREKKIWSTRSVGVIGLMPLDPSIRMVLMWNEYSLNQDPNLWISLYDRWTWAAAWESAEIRLGNIRKEHNPLKIVRNIIRNRVVSFWERREGFWAQPLVAEVDPTSPPIMAFSPDYRIPTIVLERKGTTRTVSVWSDPSKITAGANFETKFAEIRQQLEKAVS